MIGTTQGYSMYMGQPTVDSEMEPKLEDAIIGAQSFIETYIGYPLELKESVDIFDGDNSSYIFVPRFPVTEVSKGEYYDEYDDVWTDYVVENTDVRYLVNKATGQIKIINNIFIKGFQNIRLSYIAGFDFAAQTLDFRAKSVIMVLYEVAALFHDNAGMTSFQQVDAGVSKSRFGYKSGSGDAQIISMLSPEIVVILFSFAKRGVSR